MKTLMVLAGGFGVRLRSLVSDVPKPLAPVVGKPFITHLIHHWVTQGVRGFVFLLHYEACQIKAILDEFSQGSSFHGIEIKVIVEGIPLGTGGAIWNAVHVLKLQESFLVANADTWLGSGIRKLSGEAPCALAAVRVSNSQRYGSLKFEENKISYFEEKSSSIGEGYINSGLYHLLPSAFDGFEVGSSFSLEKDVFPGLVTARQLGVIKLDESFIDIGIPDDYLRFCEWMESGQANDL